LQQDVELSCPLLYIGKNHGLRSDFSVMNPDMSSAFLSPGRPRRDRNYQPVTVEHRYRVDIFYNVIDSQLSELEDRFPEPTSILLTRIAHLNPALLCSPGAIDELMSLAEMYPLDFSPYDLSLLGQQLSQFVIDIGSHSKLKDVKSLSVLALQVVHTNKSVTYPLVYRLIRLALTLPVSTASTERSFSALKLVKNRLRNRIGDEFLANALALFVEKDLAQAIDKESVIKKFESMATRRSQFS
jgi:hypothetical protein